jgi:hypothetical protein
LADAELRQLDILRIGAGLGDLAWPDLAAVLRAAGDDSVVERVVVALPNHPLSQRCYSRQMCIVPPPSEEVVEIMIGPVASRLDVVAAPRSPVGFAVVPVGAAGVARRSAARPSHGAFG